MVAGCLTTASNVELTAAETILPESLVLVQLDGSILTRTANVGASSASLHPQPVRYDFSLPRKAPVARWAEAEALPICHTQWEKDGIRYTQTVLVTRLDNGDLMPAENPAEDAVLMVQIAGDNFTNAYAEAKAELSAERDGQKLKIELKDGSAYATNSGASDLLAVIEVSASGIASPDGHCLRFSGNMPPGISGAMTLKFPLSAMKGSNAIERLRDLDFNDELRRVKRFWASHPRTNQLPVAFSK